MATPVALVTFSWASPPNPLPPGASAVASYNISVYNVQGSLLFAKNGLPATATSYTTVPADNLVLNGAGNPYKFAVAAIDAAGIASLTAAVVQFEAIPPVYSPPVPQGVTVGPVTWS